MCFILFYAVYSVVIMLLKRCLIQIIEDLTMSEKKILQELSAWVDKNSVKTKQDIYVSSFLAIKQDVNTALNSGYTAKAVWGFYRDKGSVSYTYRTFLRYVNTYIKSEPINETAQVSVVAEVQEVQHETQKEKGITGFHFNPVPNEDELL